MRTPIGCRGALIREDGRVAQCNASRHDGPNDAIAHYGFEDGGDVRASWCDWTPGAVSVSRYAFEIRGTAPDVRGDRFPHHDVRPVPYVTRRAAMLVAGQLGASGWDVHVVDMLATRRAPELASVRS